MRWLIGILFLGLFVGSFYLCRRLALAHKKRGNAVAAACLAMILVNLVLFWSPQLEFDLIAWHGYIYFRPWWMPVFAFGLLGAALGLLPEKPKRRAVAVLVGVLGIFYLFRLGATATFRSDSLTGKPIGPEQVCMQTTGYTCGAAAASTLLAQVQVTSTEREMADLCGTNAMNGTDVLGVMWGLREKLAGTPYTPKVRENQTLADLRALQLPAMATMELSFLIDHWIVVLRADSTGVLTADPLRGVALRNTDEFMAHWRGVLVKLEKIPAATP